MSVNQKIELRELIQASAGSGKTYQLTDRFLYLLFLDFKPESIVALTFSRKAAGEFFDAILQKLAKAAKELSARKELEEKFGFEITPLQVREKISELMKAMNRLTLGTLDSFFFSILSSAPLEYGLNMGFDLMNEASIREKWHGCLKQCFDESLQGRADLINAFAKARTEAEDRGFFSWMLELAISFRDLQDQCPYSKDWGQVEKIWPEDSPWRQIPKNYTLSTDHANCRDWLRDGNVRVTPELTEKMKDVLSIALRDFAEWKSGMDIDKMSTGFQRLLKASSVGGGVIALNYYRKNYQISGEWAKAVERMSAFVIGEEIKIHGIRTKGIYSLLKKVVTSYRRRVLAKGGITFSDLPLLLTNSETELVQLNREYRMDRKYHHWLLDEFQDTSRRQWSVIEPLVQEVINDPEDRRMFFCVGDQKQSIYGWRGGDSRLFEQVEETYRDRLRVEKMNLSWRSGKDVLGTVNQVFGTTTDNDLMIPRWVDNWQTHKPSPKTIRSSGSVAWWTSKSENERFQAIADLLRTIDPVARGWSCAILTQKRKTARKLVDFLRRELPGMPVEDEVGSFPTQDNGFSQFLISLLRASIHPSDQWSLGHLQMCPYFDQSASPLLEQLEEVRKLVYEQGFAYFIEKWGRQALNTVNPEAVRFANKRMRDLHSFAHSYDSSGIRNIDLFIEAAKQSVANSSPMDSCIRAMTIHGSKGLTFDMVIMPELGGNGLSSGGGFKSENGVELYHRSSDSGKGIDWVLSKPKKIIQESDPYLLNLLKSDQEEAVFESLCKFYVGMTRPARALYLFSEPYDRRSKSKNFVYLLHKTLNESFIEDDDFIEQSNNLVGERAEGFELAYGVGTPRWWNERKIGFSNKRERSVLPWNERVCRRFHATSAIRPSEKVAAQSTVTDLLEKDLGIGKKLGSEVHSIFEKIEWWENKKSIEQWLVENASGFSDQAREIFKRSLLNPKGRELFARPVEKAEIWREKSFAFFEEEVLVQGVFDRVVLHISEDGVPMQAEIIDFKTDRLSVGEDMEDLVQRHEKQLKSYCFALQRLTGLKREKIKMILFFTSLSEVYQL